MNDMNNKNDTNSRNDMSNAIYLGDIDPNKEATRITAMQLRRRIMYHLLIWDKIIISDSQLITDPKIRVLMKGCDIPDDILKDIDWDKARLEKCRGIEALFEAGLIEVAVRQNSNGAVPLIETWEGMKGTENALSYLPKDKKFIEYLSKIKSNTHSYALSDMSRMFREKLCSGLMVDPSLCGILGNSSIDNNLQQLFCKSTPLFREILDYMRVKEGDINGNSKNGKTRNRYQELYDYVYGCYHLNIPEALGCNINTKLRNIPFHIAVGEDYYGHNPEPDQIAGFNSAWTINPDYLDAISFEEFVEIRKAISGLLPYAREFLLGNIKSDMKTLEYNWNNYITILALCIENTLLKKNIKLKEKEHRLSRPAFEIFSSPALEIAKMPLSIIFPAIAAVENAVDMINLGMSAIVTLSKKATATRQQIDEISKLINVNGNTRIITKV